MIITTQYDIERLVLHNKVSFGSDTPPEISDEAINHCTDLNQSEWKSHCHGTYQMPVAACTRIHHAQANAAM
jgi:hypothetical protein